MNAPTNTATTKIAKGKPVLCLAFVLFPGCFLLSCFIIFVVVFVFVVVVVLPDLSSPDFLSLFVFF